MRSLLDRPTLDHRAALRQTQRGRLVVAVAEVVALRGYAATTVADVVAHAGVSRRTFYEHFADRETALLETYDTVTDMMVAELATIDAPTARQALRACLERFLELMAAEPAAARVALVDILAAGDAGRARFRESGRRFALLLSVIHGRAREEEPGVPDRGPVEIAAVAGGVNRVVTEHVLDGRDSELPSLVDDLERFAASVLFGAAA